MITPTVQADAQTSTLYKPAQRIFHMGYQPALDGLRGLAVLAVLINHLKLPIVKHGYLGVDIFFAISGFLITVLLVEEWRKTGSIHLGNFYMRRILRLYPALLLMLLAVSFITTARDYLLYSLTYTTNWVIALQIRPLNLELGHTWTLAIEEQYYMLWPLLLRFLLRRLPPRKLILVPLGMAAASPLLRAVYWTFNPDWWRVYAGTDMHADGLLLGSALGLAVGFELLPRTPTARRISQAAAFVVIGTMLFFTQMVPISVDWVVYVGFSGVAVASLLLVSQLVVYPCAWVVRLFTFPPLVMVGMISYGLYLWQVPILVLPNLEAVGLSPVESDVVKVVLTFIITILSYRYLETPVRRLKDRFKVPAKAARQPIPADSATP